VVLPLTILNVVFGELIPKAVALRNPVAVSTFGVRAVGAIDRGFAPLVWFLEKSTKAFLYLLPKNRASAHIDQVASVDIDHLSKQTQQYVLNLVGIEQSKNEHVMVTWDRVDLIDLKNSRDEVATIVIRSGHTRLPVLREKEVIGLLHTKEFITTLASGLEEWQSIIRPIIHVQSNAPALGTLRKMQEQKSHMAIVMHNQAPVGIVTFEDIIEEVVGELHDEDDDGTVQRLLSSQSRRRLRT
jgi:putative hemolysin